MNDPERPASSTSSVADVTGGSRLPSFLARSIPGGFSLGMPTPWPIAPDHVLAAGPAIEFRGADDGFEVDEVPSYLPCGTGEHLYLHIEKRGLSTPQVLRRLREAFALHERDIGTTGQKDARGITRQWISVPARAVEPRLAEVEASLGVTLLASARHGNKLRLGHNRGNRFVCRLDGTDAATAAAIASRATQLSQSGMPNWFGAQRFGHSDRALRDAERFLTRPRKAISKREQFWVSALQSAIWNTWLAIRVEDGSWCHALDGDILEKRENGAPFLCTDVGVDDPRVIAGEVSPSGPLHGRAMRCAERDALTRESRSLEALGIDVSQLLDHPSFGTGARRSGRVWPTAVDVSSTPTSTTVAFALTTGSYASVFLRELVGARLVDRFFDAPPAEVDGGEKGESVSGADEG